MKIFVSLLILITSVPSFSAGFLRQALGTPNNGSVVSGVNVISGWSCDSKNVEIFIDGVSLGKAGAGTTITSMSDPARCGRSDVGFSLLFNFNNLTPGSHVVTSTVDGVQFASNTFYTIQLANSTGWLSGLSKEITIDNFPAAGQRSTLDWYQSYQNFVITKVENINASDNYSQSMRLLGGKWYISYTVINTFSDQFTFNTLDSTPDSKGDYYANGVDQYSTPIVGAFYSKNGNWGIYNPGAIIDQFFNFTFSDNDHVSGCYYQISPPGSTNLSNCFPMSGVRLNNGASAQKHADSDSLVMLHNKDVMLFNEVSTDPHPIIHQPDVLLNYLSAREFQLH